MELIRGLSNLRRRHRGCVVTIGNFDGLHRGHQRICRHLIAQSKQLNVPATVITFEPHPQEFFLSDKAPERLTAIRDKLLNLRQQQIDRVLLLRFNDALAGLEAEAFIKEILVDGLGTRHLMIGDDFRFGKNRRGDLAMLQAAGEKFGYRVGHMPTFTLDGQRISSTRIRECLRQGDLESAHRLLGRPYSISGRVVRGDGIGRTWGIPTANIRFGHHFNPPLAGIFAVLVGGLNYGLHPGVASLGTRPTVHGSDLRLEVHLFDFGREIYGRHLEVMFKQKLRDEEKFASIAELRRQMEKDIMDAGKILESRVAGNVVASGC